jgi:hypothetical protein
MPSTDTMPSTPAEARRLLDVLCRQRLQTTRMLDAVPYHSEEAAGLSLRLEEIDTKAEMLRGLLMFQ